MSALIDGYDAAFFDLDGVIYLGPQAVPGAEGVLSELRAQSKKVMFVTNNAAREADVVVRQLNGLGFDADTDTLLTSAQVAAEVLSRELPAGSRILVAGSPNLVDLIREAGLEPITSADEGPVAVVQGYHPDLPWRMLDEVALAIQRGARWFATNDDASRPTERGLVPGVGGALAVIALTVGGKPTIFGKPYRPMLDEAVRRTGATRPIFCGDRLDTDIGGAHAAGMDSLLVFSGAHGKADLVAATPPERPTHIGADVGELLRPVRTVHVTGTTATCRGQQVEVRDQRVYLAVVPGTVETQLDAVWAITQLAWADPSLECAEALSALTLVR